MDLFLKYLNTTQRKEIVATYCFFKFENKEFNKEEFEKLCFVEEYVGEELSHIY